MAKLTLSPIASFSQSAITTINANMDLVEAALEKTLTRDGETPNQLVADLDMNGNDVINVALVQTEELIIDGIDIGEILDIAEEFGDVAAIIDEVTDLRDETLVAAVEADASAAAALASEISADADATAAANDAATVAAAISVATAARDAVLYGKGVFPTTAAAIGLGVVSNTTITAGSGGTDGTFDLAFTGGTGSGAAGRFVVAGGLLTQIILTAPGSYTVVPAFSFAASAGLTGAASTPVLGRNVDVGEYFWVPVADGGLYLYTVSAGPTAVDTGVRSAFPTNLWPDPYGDQIENKKMITPRSGLDARATTYNPLCEINRPSSYASAWNKTGLLVPNGVLVYRRASLEELGAKIGETWTFGVAADYSVGTNAVTIVAFNTHTSNLVVTGTSVVSTTIASGYQETTGSFTIPADTVFIEIRVSAGSGGTAELLAMSAARGPIPAKFDNSPSPTTLFNHDGVQALNQDPFFRLSSAGINEDSDGNPYIGATLTGPQATLESAPIESPFQTDVVRLSSGVQNHRIQLPIADFGVQLGDKINIVIGVLISQATQVVAGWTQGVGVATSDFITLNPTRLSGTTVTIASPAVFTRARHDFEVDEMVILTTNGALPTGLSQGIPYYVESTPTANTFTLSNTIGGPAINTSGTQSGTHQSSPKCYTEYQLTLVADQNVIDSGTGVLLSFIVTSPGVYETADIVGIKVQKAMSKLIDTDAVSNRTAISVRAATSSFLFAKPLTVTGDSLMAGTGSQGPLGIPGVIGQRTGMTVANCAIGGMRMGEHAADFDAFSWYRLADAWATNDWTLQDAGAAALLARPVPIDVTATLALMKVQDLSDPGAHMMIAFGRNDATGGVPVGILSDNDGTTYIGAINYGISVLQPAFPNLKLIFGTPAWSTIDGTPQPSGDLLVDYVEGLIAAAEYNNVPWVDTYYLGPVNAFNHTYYLIDGNHNNTQGSDAMGGRWSSSIIGIF